MSDLGDGIQVADRLHSLEHRHEEHCAACAAEHESLRSQLATHIAEHQQPQSTESTEPSTGSEITEAPAEIAEEIGELPAEAAEATGEVAGEVGETAEQVPQTVAETVADAAENAQEAVGDVGQAVEDIVEAVTPEKTPERVPFLHKKIL
jgi:methyl-accepting chemotaxis protein